MSRDRFRRHVRVFGDVEVPEGEKHAPPPRGPAAGDPLPAPSGLMLKYVPDAEIDGLKLYEATIRATSDGTKSWWELWLHVRREDGKDATFAVPVNPGGQFVEDGPGGKTWGLNRTVDPAAWNVTPSINVLAGEAGATHRVEAGEQAGQTSLWHQTPHLANVSGQRPWMDGPPPAPVAEQQQPVDDEAGYAQVPMAPPPAT